MPWLAIVDQAASFDDLFLVIGSVVAANAHAVFSAHPPLREALTVELEAVDFRAFAARVLVPRGEVEV